MMRRCRYVLADGYLSDEPLHCLQAVNKVVEEFSVLHGTVAKTQVEAQLKQIAEKRGRFWMVTDAGMLEACGLPRAPLQTPIAPIAVRCTTHSTCWQAVVAAVMGVVYCVRLPPGRSQLNQHRLLAVGA